MNRTCEKCGFGMGELEDCRYCAAKAQKRVDAKRRLKLTREQRFMLFHGSNPRIAFSAKDPCPAKVGDVLKLSPKLSIEVRGVRRTKQGEWVIEYMVKDERPIFMRRVPPVHTPESIAGFVAPPTTADIEVARVQGSYCRSSHGAVPDGDEAVPEVDHTLIEMRARTRFAEQRETERVEETAKRDLRAVTAQIRETAITMARVGVDPSDWLTDLQRQINERKAEMKEAA